MAKLILSLDGVVIRDIKIDKDRIGIGRKPHNEVVIDNLAISGEHAVVSRVENDVFIEDLGSTNGTLVNGEPVTKHLLQDNDLVEIGKYKLKYIAERVNRPQDDFEKTMVLRASPLAGRPLGGPSAQFSPGDTQAGVPAYTDSGAHRVAEVAAAKPPLGVLQILNGSHAGKELELTKNLTTVGKTGEQVAVLTRRPQGYTITHVDGPKRPIVNGVELDAQAHSLKDRDVIELAGIKMEFFYKNQ